MIRNSQASGSAFLAIDFSRVFSRSRKCGRLAILFGLLAVLAGGASNAGMAQTASYSYAIAAVGFDTGPPFGVAVDGSGNVYATFGLPSSVQEITPGCDSSSCVTWLGGGFFKPNGMAVDGIGNVYVADGPNSQVEEIPAGCVSSSCVTVLGGNNSFSNPLGVAVDGSGNVYVADNGNNAVKEMPAGCASSSCVTVLGGGFSNLTDVAVDGSGHVYVADNRTDVSGNGAVKEMPAGCASTSCITVLGGGFGVLWSVAVDSSGNVYIADGGKDGSASSVKEMPAGCASSSCVSLLGPSFTRASGIAVDQIGNVYVADTQVTEIMTRGVNFFTVPVGTASAAIPLTFTFNSAGSLNSTTPFQVLTQGGKNLDFAAAPTQESNACNGTTAYAAGSTCTVNVTFTPTKAGLRSGAVELLNASGSPIATAYIYGVGQGPQIAFSSATQSVLGGGFSAPIDVAVDGGGNVYVADDYNHALKKIPAGCTSSSCVITLGGSIYIYEPTSVAVDGGGNVYLTDWGDGSVKEIPIGCVSSSCVTRLGGPYYKPSGVAVDGQGNVYVADESWGDVVYEMPPGCASSTCMTALGGSGGLDDVFTNPWGLAVDASGNVYVANYGNQYGSWAVFEMSPRCYSSNCVTSLGGGFQSPTSVAVDASGNVYVSDVGDSVVKKMPAGCASSSCVTILGSGFYYAEGVAVDGSGNVYIADTNNNRVLKEDFADPPSLAFAAATDGATSADSPQTVTVENVGNAALSFPIPSTGNNPSISANFTLNSGGASACQVEGSATSTEATLAPGATCDLYISFTPEAVGTLSGSVVLTDNNLNAGAPGFASQSIALTGTATRATQTITFANPGTQMVGTPLTLSATASSGLPVSFTSTTASICQVSGDVATLISSGTCAIASDQAGNTDYAAASQVTESFPVNSPALASLLSPAPGLATTLGTTNVAFTWTTAVGATGYQLNLSAVGPGQSELFLYKGTATAATVTSLPPNGAEVYATLYTKISGVWQSNSYMYYESGPRPAALTSPTPGPGTILGTSNITFQWNTGAEVSEYQLNLSAIASGDSDLYSYKGTALTATVPTLPANGVNIYATLSSKINGVWQSNSYVYTESGTPAPALLTSPTPGIGTRTGFSSVTFQWARGVDVTSYQLNLSAIAAGDSELYSYKGTATSTIVPTLPANGVELYARLYSLINGAWQYKDYVYTEDGIPLAAALTWPTPGLSTILGTSNVNFLWTGGTAVSEYQLSLSAIAPGDSDLFSYKGTATTTIAPTLPANALKVYARLYSKITGTWQYNDYVYTESGTPTPAALTSPTPGLSTILGLGNVEFQWTAGVAVTDYQLSLSAIAAGDSELFLYKGSALNTTVPRLPANGVKVYARLYSYINGAWQYNDYVYTEQ